MSEIIGCCFADLLSCVVVVLNGKLLQRGEQHIVVYRSGFSNTTTGGPTGRNIYILYILYAFEVWNIAHFPSTDL